MIEGFTFEQKTIEGFNFVPDSQPETVKFSNNLQHKSNINDSMDIIISKQYYDLSKKHISSIIFNFQKDFFVQFSEPLWLYCIKISF